MTNVRVTMDGRVYIRVPVEALALMKREGYECYVSDAESDKIIKLAANKHVSVEDIVWVYIGNVCTLNKERMDLFGSVEDMARYTNENGKLPWGWRGIVRYKHWTRTPEKGTSVVINDGVNVMRYWNKKKAVVERLSLSTTDTDTDERN